MTRKTHWTVGIALAALFALPGNASAERSSLTLAKGLAKLAVDGGLKPGGRLVVNKHVAEVRSWDFAKGQATIAEAANSLARRYGSALKDGNAKRASEYMEVRRSKSGKTVFVITHRPDKDRKATRTTVRAFRNKRAHLSTEMKNASGTQYRVFERQAPQSRRQRMGHGWNSRVKRPQKGYQRFRGNR